MKVARLPLWSLELVHDGLMLMVIHFLPNCTFPTFIRQLNGNSDESSISIQQFGQWKAMINHKQSINLILIRYPINRARGHTHTTRVLLMKMIGSLYRPRLSHVENKTNLNNCILFGQRMALKCKINLSVHLCSTNHSEWKHGEITRGEKVHKPHLVNTNQ